MSDKFITYKYDIIWILLKLGIFINAIIESGKNTMARSYIKLHFVPTIQSFQKILGNLPNIQEDRTVNIEETC